MTDFDETFEAEETGEYGCKLEVLAGDFVAISLLGDGTHPRNGCHVSIALDEGQVAQLHEYLARWLAHRSGVKLETETASRRTTKQLEERLEPCCYGMVSSSSPKHSDDCVRKPIPGAWVGTVPPISSPSNPDFDDGWQPVTPKRTDPLPAPVPACSLCNDTHRAPGPNGEDWMCTRCPVPCRACAGDRGRGAYCAKTPCACACHTRGLNDPPPPPRKRGRARRRVVGTEQCDECGGLGYEVTRGDAAENCADCDGTGAITLWSDDDPPLSPAVAVSDDGDPPPTPVGAYARTYYGVHLGFGVTYEAHVELEARVTKLEKQMHAGLDRAQWACNELDQRISRLSGRTR